MTEIWEAIKGYEGKYEVSNLGRVRSLNYMHTGKSHLMRTWKNNGGYEGLLLSKNGKEKYHLVHRLVAEAFIPNPYGHPEINHKNEIKTDNRTENLEWCTSKYNSNYGTRVRRIILAHFIPVVGTLSNGDREYYLSIKSAAEGLSCCAKSIANHLRGENRTPYAGRMWQTWEEIMGKCYGTDG